MRNDLQAAVEYFEMVGHNNGPDAMVHFGPVARMEMLRQYKLARTALTALRDMLKRREGCDFCNESERIQNQYGDIMGMDDGVLILDTEGYPGVTFRIKYCPDCGRELSGNAEQVKEGEE